jgi:MFS family permease
MSTEVNPGTSRIPRTVIALGVVSLLTDAATEMIYPLLPLFIVTLGSGAVALGIIEGLAESTASLLKLLSGILSDRTGKRKPLVVVGYTISTMVRPAIGLVTGAWQIALIRTTDRIGKGIRSSPRDALIAGAVPAEIRGKAYGFHRSMDHTGAILGPLLCVAAITGIALWTNVGGLEPVLRTVFLLAIIPGTLAVMTLILFVNEPAAPAPAGRPAGFSLAAFSGNFRRYLLLVTFFTLGNSSDAFLLYRVQESIRASGALESFVAGMPLFELVLTRLGGEPNRAALTAVLFLPLVWSFFHVLKAVLSTPLGSLSDRIGRKKVIGAGWMIYAAVYAGFASLDALPTALQAPATLLLFAAYAVYYAFTEGAEKAFVADLVGPELRGSAFGLYNFAIGIAALPASVLFGLVYQAWGAPAAFGSGAVIALVSMAGLAFGVAERRV